MLRLFCIHPLNGQFTIILKGLGLIHLHDGPHKESKVKLCKAHAQLDHDFNHVKPQDCIKRRSV